MQVNIWNIYHRLSYPQKIPLVKDGGATIKGVRWIVSKDLNPDMVYIGREAEFFADADIGDRPVTVIAGGNVGPVLYRCIESLPDGQKLRITRQIYLNPPESDFELLRGKNVEIWSNSPVCLENDGKSGLHYTQHAGESYGHYYFDVLKSVLDYEP